MTEGMSIFPNFLAFWAVLISFCNVTLWDRDLESVYVNI